MNPNYIETFNRNRRLFILPVVVTTLLAFWFAFGTPKQYRASAALWAERGPAGVEPAFVDGAAATPALQTQQLLAELLTTERFRAEVGKSGPLESYMAAHPTQGFGPQALMKTLRGSGSAEERTLAALDSKHVFTIADGTHLMTLRLDGPSPTVAVGTLRALIDAFGKELDALAVQDKLDEKDQAEHQKQIYAQAVTDLETQIVALQSSGGSQAELAGLVKAQALAKKRLTRATVAYNEAKLGAAAEKTQKRTFKVTDPPAFPAPAIGGMKKSLFIVFAGFFAGALISFVGVVFLTPDTRRDKDDEDGFGGGEAVTMEAIGENGVSADLGSTARAAGGGRFRR